jgi:BCD family chlorophyll transporter-like MFS transporter
MCILSLGILTAVDATVLIGSGGALPYVLAIVGFTLIGVGVGMAGTALLALLASRVASERKPAAAAISWTMMVAGIVIAAAVSGSLLDPFSGPRLAIVASGVILAAFCLAMLALHNLEAGSQAVAVPAANNVQDFRGALRAIWAEAEARRFTWFVFVSMVAYSTQDLILEPFAGLMFGFSPGESTQLAGLQHSGILVGMLIAGLGGTLLARRHGPNVRLWILLGCFGSALMLAGLSMAALVGPVWPLKANVFALGLANGIFAVAAVGAMLGLASDGHGGAEGARMGVWGAAQAIAFGTGGLAGAMAVDALRSMAGQDDLAFATVFAAEALLFIAAALVAVGTTLARSLPIRKAVEI